MNRNDCMSTICEILEQHNDLTKEQHDALLTVWSVLQHIGDADFEDNNDTRICTCCNKAMMEGYCIHDGLEYYCSDECLHSKYTDEEYLEMYDDGEGDSYYTDWY